MRYVNFSLMPPYPAGLRAFVLGITSAQAADWPRQVTDSRGVHTLESKPCALSPPA
jgi:ABC-type Fe2+-enterobactin transport system substrate-binding protein